MILSYQHMSVFAYTFLSMKLPLTSLFYNKTTAKGLKNHYYLLYYNHKK